VNTDHLAVRPLCIAKANAGTQRYSISRAHPNSPDPPTH